MYTKSFHLNPHKSGETTSDLLQRQCRPLTHSVKAVVDAT